MSGAPREVQELAAQRAALRAAKDYQGADVLRDRIASAGWEVVDEPGGWRLEAAPIPEANKPPARPHPLGPCW